MMSYENSDFKHEGGKPMGFSFINLFLLKSADSWDRDFCKEQVPLFDSCQRQLFRRHEAG